MSYVLLTNEERYYNQEAQVWPPINVNQGEQAQIEGASITGQIIMNDELDFTKKITQDSLDSSKEYVTLLQIMNPSSISSDLVVYARMKRSNCLFFYFSK